MKKFITATASAITLVALSIQAQALDFGAAVKIGSDVGAQVQMKGGLHEILPLIGGFGF